MQMFSDIYHLEVGEFRFQGHRVWIVLVQNFSAGNTQPKLKFQSLTMSHPSPAGSSAYITTPRLFFKTAEAQDAEIPGRG